jgi:ribose transport system permease protein
MFNLLKNEKKRFTSTGLPIPALIALLIICIFTSTRSPQFLTIENFNAIADQAAITLIIACGLTFVILMGSIDLSIQGIIAASAMSVSLLIANDRTNFNLGNGVFIVGIGIGAFIGLLAGIAVTLIRIPSFIVTIATWNFGLGIGYMLFGSGQQPGIQDKEFIGLGIETFLGLTKIVWIAVAVALLSFMIQRYTIFGRYAYVIGGSEETAILSGINVKKFRILAFVFSGGLSGLAGTLLASKMSIGAVNSGEGLLFLTVSSVVIGGTLLNGGRGGILHSIIGVLIMTTIYIAMILLDVSSFFQKIVQGLVVLIVVVIASLKQRKPLRTVL